MVEPIDTSKLKAIKYDPQIGFHLASLNLFREADGKLYITCSGATGAIAEMKAEGIHEIPVDYVDGLVIEAAEAMKARRNKDGIVPG